MLSNKNNARKIMSLICINDEFRFQKSSSDCTKPTYEP